MRLLSWVLFVLVLVFLFGCQTVDTKPAPIIEPPKQINVAIRAPCIKESDIPAVPQRTKVGEDADEEQLATAVKVYVAAMEDTVVLQNTLLKICSKP